MCCEFSGAATGRTAQRGSPMAAASCLALWLAMRPRGMGLLHGESALVFMLNRHHKQHKELFCYVGHGGGPHSHAFEAWHTGSLRSGMLHARGCPQPWGQVSGMSWQSLLCVQVAKAVTMRGAC